MLIYLNACAYFCVSWSEATVKLRAYQLPTGASPSVSEATDSVSSGRCPPPPLGRREAIDIQLHQHTYSIDEYVMLALSQND